MCYITVAGFLNGPGFQKMREQLRRQCDEIWVIDCSPEGHQPEVSTRIFQGVQHPVCITIAARSPSNDPDKPARVHYRSLAKGKRDLKFEEFKAISLAGKGWVDGASEWRAPFLPEHSHQWGSYPAIEQLLRDRGLGSMAGRTWVVAPDTESLKRRWQLLLQEKDEARRADLFHPHLRNGQPGDRHIGKGAKGLRRPFNTLASIDFGLANSKSDDEAKARAAKEALTLQPPDRYGFRSFDRQWIIPDARLINQPNPGIWEIDSDAQVFITALSRSSPRNGPAVTITGLVPDHDHYKGSASGRVFALWEDTSAKNGNVCHAAMAALTKTYGAAPKAEDVFAYIAALIANPAYTEKFKSDLVRPGLRVPLTADKKLFAKAVEIGREVIWLHTFGERFNDGRDPGVPKLPQAERPFIPKEGGIPSTPEGFPDTIDYDAAKRRLKVGAGYIENVPPEVWAYEVSGKQVLRQWFSYRKKNREKPQIGDRRPPSPLGEIQPDHWLPEYTTELLNVINVLGLLVKLEPKQLALLEEIIEGPLIPASKVTASDKNGA